MTDDYNIGWNAFASVFGESKHLLCKWHLTRTWRRKLKLVLESIQDDFMCTSSYFKREGQFKTLQESFLKRHSLVAPTFIKYYRDKYAGRVEKWDLCFQQFENCKTDTNLFAESFHNKLKTFFMERKPNKRLDDLINFLLAIEQED